ncbi:MAG TPA: ATP-binding protein [Burkholderiaceae bacterium]|nr:ATP-binding protein [Burkholderiaceae bacterium]HNB43206.1 ATP-binding protein [Burkholderiaceae bacterium]HNG78039.1 ATP-binding protein [Burkholderiaceae bacterium]
MSSAVTPPPAAAVTPAVAAAPRIPLSRFAMLFAAATLAVVWLAVVLLLVDKHGDTLAAEARQNTNIARALNEQTLRVIAATDQATLRVRDDVASGQAPKPDLVRYANETGLAPKILVQLSLVGADGRFLGSNLDPDGSKTGHVDLSEREHVRIHLNPAYAAEAAKLPPNGLFISKPVLGKVSKRWTIQLSRKITAADGRALGAVVASLDPAYFEEVFRQVALGQQGGVTIAGTDLTVRARVIGGKAVDMGGKLGASSPLARGELGNEGNYIAPSSLDAVPRTIAYHKVADYPIYIFVSSSTDEALAGWRSYRNMLVGLSLLLSLAVGAAAVIFLGSLRRLERSNEALALSEAQAQAASKAKSEFLAAISHELRTPLTSIRGFAELMEKRIEQPKFRDMAGLIRKGAEHLNALLTEILDLAKVEAGAMPMNPEPQALRELLDQSVGFFQVSAAEKGLTLAAQFAPDAPASWLCDGLRLKQIINNLLSNAVKFTEAGGVRVEVEADHERLRLHVIDTGPGIAPELQETVFERFRQGNDRVSYQHGGTGLGLALARALAERMGGTLTLQSAVGEGSRFTLTLPAVPPA